MKAQNGFVPRRFAPFALGGLAIFLGTIAFAAALYVFMVGPLSLLFSRPSTRPFVEPMSELYRPLECGDSCTPKLHCHLLWQWACAWELDGTISGCPAPSLEDARTSSGQCSPYRYFGFR